MGKITESVMDLDIIIRDQRTNKPSPDLILKTMQELPVEHLVEYLAFLEHTFEYKSGRDVSKTIFERIGITDSEFIETYSANLDSRSLERLSLLVFAKSDKLLDCYLHTAFPSKMINEYALLKANQINTKYKGHFRNALELIKLGIELNKGQNPEELFTIFKKQKEKYYETNIPPIDISTFFKLIIPILKRCSVKRGPDGFYEMRDRIIDELLKDGLTPEQLSIDILDRRTKNRTRNLTMDDYKGFDLY